MKKDIFLLFSIISIVAFVSCRSNDIRKHLIDIESYIQESPDSALVAIRALDTNALFSQALKAQYSLLQATALDKNYIDTTDLSVIMPAIEYYEKTDDAVHNMRAWYYHGRILQNAGKPQDAMYSFSKALDESKKTEDFFYKGLINSVIAGLYSTQYSSEEALKYAKDAYNCFMQTTDTLGQWLHQGKLAVFYGNNRDKEKSDSVFKEYMSRPVLDTLVFTKNLFAYAQMLLRKPSNPEKCIELFQLAKNEYKGKPRIRDYYFYAAALEKTGKGEEAEKLLKKLEVADTSSTNSNYWRYVIYRHQHNFKKALILSESAIRGQDSVIISNLHQSLERSRNYYFEEKAAKIEQMHKNALLKGIIFVIVLILIMFGLCVIIITVKKRQGRRIEELEDIRKDLSNRLETSLTSYAEMDKKVEELRRRFYSQHREQFKLLDKLCSAYYLPTFKGRKERIYEEVKDVLASIANKSGNTSEIEALANTYLDNIIIHLREDVPDQTESSYQLFAYLVLGISPKTIAAIENISPSAVYTRTYRLKTTLQKIDSVTRDKYLYFLR